METAILIDEKFIADYEKKVYQPHQKEATQQRDRLQDFKKGLRRRLSGSWGRFET